MNQIQFSPGFWNGKRVIVTGGGGFLGSYIVDLLSKLGANIYVPRSRDYDLTLQYDVKKLYKDFKAHIVIHCAVTGGGIGFMMNNPATTFYNNIMMDTLLMEEARKSGVEKFIGIGTVCSYPKFAPVPFKEEGLWDGYPEETNAPYGLSKKMMLVQSEAYKKQYGFNSINLLLVNLYGPRDNFDSKSSHVIPALIKKCSNALKDDAASIEVWGNGEAIREFLYVEDAAKAVVMAAERYESYEPVNIGSGSEISIKDLVNLIAQLTGFTGDIKWNRSLPNGQPRRRIDTSKAFREFGFKADTSLETGLEKTIEWWRNFL